MATETSTSRLEARLPTDVHALLKRAAEIQGRTLTDFVVASARDAACRTTEEREILRLSVEDQRRFAAALLAPSTRQPPCAEPPSGISSFSAREFAVSS
jgi:uncharacterized protein (DUF1778 family)